MQSIKGANAPANSTMSSMPCQKRSYSPDGLARSSFSSIRERDSDLTQTFTSSKISCFSSHNLKALADEIAVSDESSPASPLSVPSILGDTPLEHASLLLPSQQTTANLDLQSTQDHINQSVLRSLAWLNTRSEDGSFKDTTKRQDRLMKEDRASADSLSANNVADIVEDQDMQDVELIQPKQSFERLPNEIHRTYSQHTTLFLCLPTCSNSTQA